jgi:hypothetical protein
MTKTLKNILVTLAGLSILLAPVYITVESSALSLQFASSTAGDDFCSGAGAAQGDSSSGCGGTGTIDSLLKTIVNIVSLVVGVLAVIMVIVSGARFMTSNGDPNKIASARTALIYALIGIAVAALAQIIIRFVVNRSLGAVGG